MSANNETPKRDQRLKPGERALTIRIPEAYYRRWTSRRSALGLRSEEYLCRLVDLEADHPIPEITVTERG